METFEPGIDEEIRDYMSRGFVAAWMGDLKVGDIFAGPRTFEFDPPRTLFVVEQIAKEDQEYLEEDDSLQRNVVMHMIVTDEKKLQRHLTYGSTHGIYIYRGFNQYV